MRNRLLLTAALTPALFAALLWLAPRQVCAVTGCKDTYVTSRPRTTSFNCNLQENNICPLTQTLHWTVYFLDGYQRDIDPEGSGVTVNSPSIFCGPEFRTPTFVNETTRRGRWTQLVHDGAYEPSSTGCSYSAEPRVYTVGHTCSYVGSNVCTTPGFDGSCPEGTFADGFGRCCPGTGPSVCTGEGTTSGGSGFEAVEDGGSSPPPDMDCTSPVLIDVAGDGFRLTDAAGGVLFDLNGNGALDGRLAWTPAGADDAWLALDRDGDGLVTSGRELFGNFTEQPEPPAGESRNGFLALAEFDRPQQGGNADGAIDAADAVFASLRLWRDENHDGVSQPGELRPPAALDVVRLHLDYKESKRVDGHGNRFKYRAKVDDARGAKVNRWSWDVFLVTGP